MLLQMAGYPFYGQIIFHYIYIIFSLFICPLTDTVSMSWQLLIMLQQTWEYRYFFEILILLPSDIFPEVELHDYKVVLFVIF